MDIAGLGELSGVDQRHQLVEGPEPVLKDGIDLGHVFRIAEKLIFDHPHLRPDDSPDPVGLGNDRPGALGRFGEQQIVDRGVEPPDRALDLEGGVTDRKRVLIDGLGDAVNVGDPLKRGAAEYPGQE